MPLGARLALRQGHVLPSALCPEKRERPRRETNPRSCGRGRSAGAPAGSAMGRSQRWQPLPCYGRDLGIWKQHGPCSLPCQGCLGKLWDPRAPTIPCWCQSTARGGGADLPGLLSLKPAVDRDQHSTSRSSLVGWVTPKRYSEVREVTVTLHTDRQSTG